MAYEKIKGIIAKIKSIKHIEIILAVLGVAIMLLIFAGIGDKKCENTSVEKVEETKTHYIMMNKKYNRRKK